MASIGFELKKLWKQKAFLVMTVFALLTTIYSIVSIGAPNYFNMSHEFLFESRIWDPMTLEDYQVQLFRKSFNNTITPEEQEQLDASERFEEVRYKIYLKNQDIENYMLEHNEEYLVLRSEKNQKFSELINLLDFEFIPKLLDNINYEKYELDLLMNQGLVYESIESTGMTSSLVFRYGLDKLWGAYPCFSASVICFSFAFK